MEIETITGTGVRKRKGKLEIVQVRIDSETKDALFQLSEKSHISCAELIRESIRRLLEDSTLMGTSLSV